MSTNSTDSAMHIKTSADIYRLPVLPETIKISSSANNSSDKVVNIGEITQKQGRKAKVISFKSFFPAEEFNGSVSGTRHPIAFVNALEKAIDQKETVRFTFSRSGSDRLSISMLCTIEKFEYNEDGDDPDTIHYSITLKEYRTPTVNQLKQDASNNASKQSNSNRPKTNENTKTYTIKKGDTLWAIAKKHLGSGNRYTEIYELNKAIIEKVAKEHGRKSSSNGHWIYAGTVITLP